jgi:drug/metabolite transporter (DMT)-like permease
LRTPLAGDEARPLDYAVMVAGALMLSSNLVIGRYALDGVGPWTLALLRWAIAAAILWLLAWPRVKAHAAEIRAQATPIVALGFLGMVVCGGGVYAALAHTTATNGTLIYATSPVLIIVLELLFRGRSPTLRQATGVALAFGGVAVIAFSGDPSRVTELRLNPGDLGIAFGALSWAGYTVILRQPGIQSLPGLPLFAAIAAAGALMLLPFSLVEAALGGTLPSRLSDWLAVLTLAIVPSVAAFSAYQYATKKLGPTVAGLSIYLMPVFGVALAALVLGEAFHRFHAAGLLFVVAGLLLGTAPIHLLRRMRPPFR